MNHNLLHKALLAVTTLLVFWPSPAFAQGSRQTSADTAVLVGAGDISDCKDPSGAEATAQLLEK
ncbi:MAG TPA: hypothetical protein VEI26_05700, partial [Terriglobales bacterium]|nr:hypothetical protein [Terriglobales bacterium]